MLQSEFNTLSPDHFKGEAWFKQGSALKYEVDVISLEQFCAQQRISPQIIKIDVEGAEWQTVQGLEGLLKEPKPIIILEYVVGNEDFSKIFTFMGNYGMRAFLLEAGGELKEVAGFDVLERLMETDSENLVFLADGRV